jgi:hypothetical protein
MVQRKSECGREPRQSATKNLINKFERSESVINNKKGVVSKKNCLRTPENIYRVERALKQSSMESVKLLPRQLNLEASRTYRIIREDMKTGAYFWKDLAQQYCTRIFIWH